MSEETAVQLEILLSQQIDMPLKERAVLLKEIAELRADVEKRNLLRNLEEVLRDRDAIIADLTRQVAIEEAKVILARRRKPSVPLVIHKPYYSIRNEGLTRKDEQILQNCSELFG